MPIVVIALVLLGSDAKPSNSGKTPKALPAVSVPAPPPNPSADAPCTKLLGSLPTAIPTSNGPISGRPAQSDWTYVAAWGDPAIVLRCGVPRPAALTANSSALLVPVNGVAFLPVNTKKANIFTAVDRAAYIEISVPVSYPQPPLGPLADGIAKALPAVCLPQAAPGQPPVDPAKLCSRRP